MSNTEAIKALRTFAGSSNQPAFAHLCTVALAGEGWAIERISDSIDVLSSYSDLPLLMTTDDLAWIIANTDTTRPDGAIARSFQP